MTTLTQGRYTILQGDDYTYTGVVYYLTRGWLHLHEADILSYKEMAPLTQGWYTTLQGDD